MPSAAGSAPGAAEPMSEVLLVLDVQVSIVERAGAGTGTLHRIALAVRHAHSVGMRVIPVIMGFRDGYPEVASNNLVLTETAARNHLRESDPRTAVHPAVGALPNDAFVVKRRVSAFVGTDLAPLLRAQGCEHLVLTGLTTSGVVLATLLDAADRDFRITVLADACDDRDRVLHDALVQRLFPRWARVTSTSEWIQASTVSDRNEQGESHAGNP